MAGKADRRDWGSVREVATGRQASYTHGGKRRFAPIIFLTESDATKWLAGMRTQISGGTWVDPDFVQPLPDSAPTLREYAPKWIVQRRVKGKPLAQGTKDDYDSLLRNHILPHFGDVPMGEITCPDVRTWMAREAPPVVMARAFTLMNSILNTALRDKMIVDNPCSCMPGAGSAETTLEVQELSRAELGALVRELPVRYRALALLQAWCSLRFGESVGIKCEDLDLDAGVVHIRRGITRHRGVGLVEVDPKTKAGKRPVTVPANIIEALRDHLDCYSEPGPTGLVFPARFGGKMGASSYQRVFNAAAARIGRPDVTPHQLRHFGQTSAAALGADLPTLMQRAGQVSPAAALRYIKATRDQQRKVADDLGTWASEGTG